MQVSENLLKQFPKKLDENQLAALLKLVSVVNKKSDVIKVDSKQLEALFEYGRDRTEKTIDFLHDNNYIKRDQKRDEKGRFVYNEITITTSLITD